MAKYDVKFKQEVVQKYLAGGSARGLAKEYVSLVRPKKYRSYRGLGHAQVENLLQRKFKAERFGEKWVTDVTQFKVGGKKLYLSPVTDLYNGEIVAYQTSRSPQFQMVDSMLKKAISTLKGTVAPRCTRIRDGNIRCLPAHLGRKRHYAEHVAQRELPG